MTYPKPYQSAFRDACFVLGGLYAFSGMDIEISSLSHLAPLGVKRIYTDGTAAVNAAPYIRRLLSPEPMCGDPLGIAVGPGRAVTCRICSGNYVSAVVYLTAGTEDAPVSRILSESPGTAKISFGETDEISVITAGNRARPVISFSHGGVEYTDSSLTAYEGSEMMTLVVNADDVGEVFAGHTGADAGEMTEFTVSLRIAAGSSEVVVSRRYEVVRNTGAGCRLAWVNRYGAVDYYTFPNTVGGNVSGSRERIYTADGYRTVATAAETSETLLSEQCGADGVKWLSEIFSSPAVWRIDGADYEKVEVAGGSAEYSAQRPGTVEVSVAPERKTVSRKF